MVMRVMPQWHVCTCVQVDNNGKCLMIDHYDDSKTSLLGTFKAAIFLRNEKKKEK